MDGAALFPFRRVGGELSQYAGIIAQITCDTHSRCHHDAARQPALRLWPTTIDEPQCRGPLKDGMMTAENIASRRAFLVTAASGLAAAGGLASSAHATSRAPLPIGGKPGFEERLVLHGSNRIYVREWKGKGPAFVLLHGFPDNLHIYDDLAPALAAQGRHVVSFDFLGFGHSDKPSNFTYNFEQQRGDLAAVADALDLQSFIPVGHDAGGPAAVNYALSNPARIKAMILLNTFYTDATTLHFPELITLCADPELKALAMAMMTDPAQGAWILAFQQAKLRAGLPPAMQARFDTVLQPLINANFADGAGPAFMQMTADLYPAKAYNTSRAAEMKRFAPPVTMIWGSGDPYLNPGVAEDLAARFPNGSVKLVASGHWPQIDRTEDVARLML